MHSTKFCRCLYHHGWIFIHGDINSHKRHRNIFLKTKMIFCNRCLQSNNNYYDTHCTMHYNHFNTVFVFSLYHCTSMKWKAIIIFFVIEGLTEEGQKRPKYVGGLPHVSILRIYLIILKLLQYVWWLVLLHRTWKIFNLSEFIPYLVWTGTLWIRSDTLVNKQSFSINLLMPGRLSANNKYHSSSNGIIGNSNYYCK
jgi:hypothetical protein